MIWHRMSAPLVLILALAFAASPLWVPDFGGFDPNAFPVPQDRPPVQPAGYAFAIWGPIFLWLVAGAVIGLVARRYDPVWQPMRGPLALSLGVGAIWLPVATLSPIWATILIWAMLLPALWAVFVAPRHDRWAATLPIGLYAGWLSAASCVAIGLLLGGYAILDETVAAFAIIGLATVLACTLQWRLPHVPTYGLAAIWAFLAIGVQNGFGTGIGAAASAAALLLVLTTARGILKARRKDAVSPNS